MRLKKVRLLSWWLNALIIVVKQRWVVVTVITILGIALVVLLILGYRLDWDWTGLGAYIPPTKDSNFQRGKTLWDWLQLLIVPLMLAIGGFWLNQMQKEREEKTTEQQSKTERGIAEDNQRETVLQDYIDKMSELLLDRKLRESKPEDEVRTIARVRTLTTLSRLDGKRKGSIIQFLKESGLIEVKKSIIDLSKADLSRANLSGADLNSINLRETDLSEADLSNVFLSGADLTRAKLCKANLRGGFLGGADVGYYLRGADLRGADLRGANLRGADLNYADLNYADLNHADLYGADLSGADLNHADLNHADLYGADLSRTKLGKANITTEQLKNAKSLKHE